MSAKAGVFVIAEAGSNWKTPNGPKKDLARAKRLIDAAAWAGADAVKFQTFNAETVYAPGAGVSRYLSKHGIRRSIEDLFRELAMPHAMLPKLAAHCRKRKIEFMSSYFSPEDFKAVNPLVRRHKIASYEITHGELIRLAAKSGKPTLLSTGAAELADIDWAVAQFRKSGGRQLTLMQCTAKYPAPLSALNLRVIPSLAKRYQVPCGLSDHSTDPVIGAVAAVALGATAIEKHFTLDRKLVGPDHAFAIEPGELKSLVLAVRAASAALGTGKKQVLPEEMELHRFAQRALQATRFIAKGERLMLNSNFSALRPGSNRKGGHPRHAVQLNGKPARRAIAIGEGIRMGDAR